MTLRSATIQITHLAMLAEVAARHGDDSTAHDWLREMRAALAAWRRRRAR